MDGVDLDSVYSRLLAHQRGLPEGVHQVVDLLPGQSPVLEVWHPDVGYAVGGSHHQSVAGRFVYTGSQPYELGSPESGSQLEEILGPVGVNLVYDFLHRAEEDVLLLIEVAVHILDSGHSGDDQSDSAADSRHVVVPDMRVELSVMS